MNGFDQLALAFGLGGSALSIFALWQKRRIAWLDRQIQVAANAKAASSSDTGDG